MYVPYTGLGLYRWDVQPVAVETGRASRFRFGAGLRHW